MNFNQRIKFLQNPDVHLMYSKERGLTSFLVLRTPGKSLGQLLSNYYNQMKMHKPKNSKDYI